MVRVHRDSHADHLASQVNARAFTVGQDLFFGSGQWSPGLYSGNRRIAHELAHGLQQLGPLPWHARNIITRVADGREPQADPRLPVIRSQEFQFEGGIWSGGKSITFADFETGREISQRLFVVPIKASVKVYVPESSADEAKGWKVGFIQTNHRFNIVSQYRVWPKGDVCFRVVETLEESSNDRSEDAQEPWYHQETTHELPDLVGSSPKLLDFNDAPQFPLYRSHFLDGQRGEIHKVDADLAFSTWLIARHAESSRIYYLHWVWWTPHLSLRFDPPVPGAWRSEKERPWPSNSGVSLTGSTMGEGKGPFEPVLKGYRTSKYLDNTRRLVDEPEKC